MVVSKRCKMCTAIEADNLPISGQYFGRLIPEMIEKISGVELDPKKLTDVLICHQCAILLVHTESVVNKLKKCMLRLKKPQKSSTTTKTPSKEAKCQRTSTATPKQATTAKANAATAFKKFCDEGNAFDGSTLNDNILATPQKKNSVKRKLNPPEKSGDSGVVNGDDIIPKVGNSPKKIKRKQELSDDGSYQNSGIEVEISSSKGTKRLTTTAMTIDETDLKNLTADETDINATNDEKAAKTKELNCVLCGKKFTQKSALREHIETSHMGEKLKECPNCSVEFRSLQKYESHVFGEKCKNTLHPCQFSNCHKRFKNVYRMEAHMREKHLTEHDSEVECI